MALFDQKKNQNNNPVSMYQQTIAERDQEINFLYDELGKLYFRQYRDPSVDVSRDLEVRCEKIATGYYAIENCRLRILYDKGYKECKNCKKPNLLEHAFCCACGSKFPDTNDINVVTAVDPDNFVINIPKVTRIPYGNENQNPAQTVPPIDSIPQTDSAVSAPDSSAQGGPTLPDPLSLGHTVPPTVNADVVKEAASDSIYSNAAQTVDLAGGSADAAAAVPVTEVVASGEDIIDAGSRAAEDLSDLADANVVDPADAGIDPAAD
ncbi:MAG: hypothetical protein K6E26_05260 [Clostridiales bacterium]|nr:hypothetical protein [Clostridiales bacterium]